ncbi:NAD(P)/FAD-dependent oxidoreductase [Nitrospirota bacterium]
MKDHYDVIIVGAGPAGIFTALELSEKAPSLSILIIEKGSEIEERHCPLLSGAPSCATCAECAILSGWGGAGAFSDGKLGLSPDVGGYLERYISRDDLVSFIEYVDKVYLGYGAPENVYGEDEKAIDGIKRKAALSDLLFVPSRIRHIGTDKCLEVLRAMELFLRSRVNIAFKTSARDILVSGRGRNKRIDGVRLGDGTDCMAGHVVLAPGREGSKWLEDVTKRHGLSTLRNPVDIGVRVEVPAAVMEPLTSVTYEPKLVFVSRSFEDRVRTFCVNPYGEVVKEYLKGVWTVNGHSYGDRRTDNTNFALLVSSAFTEPFDEPISYGRHIASLANFLSGGILLQKLGDLRAGRRSTHERISKGHVVPSLKDATPGDLSYVLPYRHMTSIIEMLEALDDLVPGVNSSHTLIYGVEVKFYSLQMKLKGSLETDINGLYAVGDGAGVISLQMSDLNN